MSSFECPTEYTLYTFSSDFFVNKQTHVKTVHPLCQFVRKAIPLLDMDASSLKTVYLDKEQMIDESLLIVDKPCLTVASSSSSNKNNNKHQVQEIINKSGLKSWCDMLCKTDFASVSKYEELCDEFIRAEERMLESECQRVGKFVDACKPSSSSTTMANDDDSSSDSDSDNDDDNNKMD